MSRRHDAHVLMWERLRYVKLLVGINTPAAANVGRAVDLEFVSREDCKDIPTFPLFAKPIPKQLWDKLTESFRNWIMPVVEQPKKPRGLTSSFAHIDDAPFLNFNEVEIIVRGKVGTGKSAIVELILRSLREVQGQTELVTRIVGAENIEEHLQWLNMGGTVEGDLKLYRPVISIRTEYERGPGFEQPAERRRKAYEEGRKAFREGAGVSSNPYVADTITQPEADGWNDGLEAQRRLSTGMINGEVPKNMRLPDLKPQFGNS